MISQRSKRAGIKELEIFDKFRVDTSLPKYKQGDDDNTIKSSFINGNIEGITVDSDSNAGIWLNNNGWNIDSNEDDDSFEKMSFFKRLKIAFKPKKHISKKKKMIKIRDYFINLADHFNELTPIADVADHYEKAITQANKLGQTSLVEKLKNMLDVVRSEAHLIQMGITKYVTNEQVCDFYESIDEDKNLKLTWIENFVKVIPNDIIELKDKIDKRGLFDNYVILHYDPNNDATSLTKEEIETKKDPILFGVIKNSKRLYYIGDWVDEYCDLTLEKMFEELGEKTLEINNRNLKTFIDKSGDYELKRKKKRKPKKTK